MAFFNKIIAIFQFQPHLNIIETNKFCSSLFKLRMSSHRLHTETGRWTKPLSTPIYDRKCSVCNILEDEYHFILECQKFYDLKIKLKLIPDLYRIRHC